MYFTKFKSKLSILKEKAIEMKEKVIELKDKTVETTAKKMSESSLVLKTESELTEFIAKSENKKFTTKEGEEKTFIKRVFVIAGNGKENFFQDMIIALPILLTKAFSQSLQIKMIDTSNENIDLKPYKNEVFPALFIFENKELYKTISGEENVKKVVKTMSLDINKTIEEI